jgi:hypothetical protein
LIFKYLVLRNYLFQLIKIAYFDISSLGNDFKQLVSVLIEKQISLVGVHLVQLADQGFLRL